MTVGDGRRRTCLPAHLLVRYVAVVKSEWVSGVRVDFGWLIFSPGPARPVQVRGRRSTWRKSCQGNAHLWPDKKDRTRTVMDAVLGGLRTGCGPENHATKEIAGQAA
jgi:hypothetical protein